jgi:hypothetical protein
MKVYLILKVYLIFKETGCFQSTMSQVSKTGKNGLVFETKYESKKVVIQLHQSTLLLHIQGASCIKWFESIFNNIAMEIHNIHDSALFNEENSIAQSSTLDTSETDPKQMLSHSMTTDTLTGSVVYTSAIEMPCGFNTPMHSSTPRTRFTNNQSCCQVNTLIRSLLSKWNV